VNHVRSRLASLALLDRALQTFPDEELASILDGLGDDHVEAVDRIAEVPEGADQSTRVLHIRAEAVRGRLNGGLEQLTTIISDACLADCIEQLGDHADNPTEEELRDVLPGIVERHGLAITRLMMASAITGEAKAAPILIRLLKHDDEFRLPPAPEREIVPVAAPAEDDPEREALRAQRKERRRQQQEAARQRREQSKKARGRS
jgi:hypothetical protein